MTGASRQPGWDKQAINRIARDLYGGLDGMFLAHGWTTDGRVISQIAPTKVVATYGNVAAFVRAHEHGVDGNAMLDPQAAILSNPPDVWLTSYYGFTPESWGFLGFTKEWMRDRFLRDSKPGALVVIYGAGGAIPSERRKILGIQQQSHLTGEKWQFLSPARVAEERSDRDRGEKWVHAVQAVRAWRIPPEYRPTVDEFAPDTFSKDNATAIGSLGLRLTASEARGILDLNLVEVEVFGGEPVEAVMVGPAANILSPSKPGPVAQTSYVVHEAEGPKHLYILRLHGKADDFLGYSSEGRWIVKVGFSVSPQTRCDAYNKALPAGAFKWDVGRSTYADGRDPFPSSRHALAGEKMMKDMLHREGNSLGGEFFLADIGSIDRAWKAAVEAAEKWTI